MGNRVYLSFTNFDHYPSDAELEQFRGEPGNEFEAGGPRIPLFWLCLFDAQHIVRLSAEGRAYPGLLADKQSALLTAQRRLAALEPHLGPRRVALYQQWLDLVRSQPSSHVRVATVEFDWMDSEGVLENDLRRAFDVLNGPAGDSFGITAEWRLADLVGLSHHRMLGDCESFELVSGGTRWPEPFAPAAQPEPPAIRRKRKVGNTWRNSLPDASLAEALLSLVVSVTLSVVGVLKGVAGDTKGYMLAVFFGLCAILPTLQLQQLWRDARRRKQE